jgi:hypothetical protein
MQQSKRVWENKVIEKVKKEDRQSLGPYYGCIAMLTQHW